MPAFPKTSRQCLSYVPGWVTGLIFLLIDKRPFVRFHAAQSLVIFGGIHIVRFVAATVFGFGWWYGGFGLFTFTAGAFLLNCISLLGLVLWIVLMVKAYQGIRYKLPVAGDIAEGLAGSAV